LSNEQIRSGSVDCNKECEEIGVDREDQKPFLAEHESSKVISGVTDQKHFVSNARSNVKKGGRGGA
jgi:hypothetical protein